VGAAGAAGGAATTGGGGSMTGGTGFDGWARTDRAGKVNSADKSEAVSFITREVGT
jgi:hypothetical protein